MEKNLTKPLPVISNLNRPFWQATVNEELRLQRCNSCGQLWAPIGCVCPHCFSEDFQWEKLSGLGKIVSWVVFHKLYIPSFAEDIPYNVAFVELKEGPRIISNIVGINNSDIHIGLDVKVVFEEVSMDIRVPKFKPAQPA